MGSFKSFRLFIFLILSGIVFLNPTASYADCANPVGRLGTVSFTSGGGDISTMMACNGTDWIPWAGWSVSGYPAPQYSSSSGGGGASVLGDLTDVDITGYADGKVLMYSASPGKWVPGLISGSGSGGGGGSGTSLVGKFYMAPNGADDCEWSINSRSFTKFTTPDSDCNNATVTGSASIPSEGKIPAIKFASLPAGDYEVTVVSGFWTYDAVDCTFRITDGTNSAGLARVTYEGTSWMAPYATQLTGTFSYGSDQTDITFYVETRSDSGSCRIYNGSLDFGTLEIWVTALNGGGGAPIIDQIATSGQTVNAVTISATNDKWPDYITCSANSGASTETLRLAGYSDSAGGNYVDYYEPEGGDGVSFFADGSYDGVSGVDANCGASAGDIDSICDDNRCGFFGGGSGGSGGTASSLGDLSDVDTSGYSNGEVLMYSAGAGGWVPGTPSGGAIPGGSNTQIQFNDGGSALGGDPQFTWDKSGNTLTIDGDIQYTGMLTDTSDRRLKENITPLQNPLGGILALQGYSFTMKGDETGAVEYGLMAQDVQPVFPELVITRDDGSLALNYIGLIAPMVESIKALKAENEDLKARLDALEQQQKQTGEQ